MKPTVLVVSCEHAVNTIPPQYLSLFAHHEPILRSHLAVDFGALEITTLISQSLNLSFTQSEVSRLLIDCNRSLSHSHCFSKFTRTLSIIEKHALIEQYYLPFREHTKAVIESHINNNEQVLHVSVHTFKPILKGLIQKAGLGILYDPHRHGEKEVARIWHGLLLQQTPAYRLRMNYPFRGNQDNFTTTLRREFSERDYLGMELEINQALLHHPEDMLDVANSLSNSLQGLLELL